MAKRRVKRNVKIIAKLTQEKLDTLDRVRMQCQCERHC